MRYVGETGTESFNFGLLLGQGFRTGESARGASAGVRATRARAGLAGLGARGSDTLRVGVRRDARSGGSGIRRHSQTIW